MKKIKRYKDNLYKQKKRYLFLISIVLIGIVLGMIYFMYLSKSNKALVFDHLNDFFLTIKQNEIDYNSSLFNGLCSNLCMCLLIWILGISIVGIPFILAFLFYKAFVIGLSICSIISCYGFKGIFGAILYVFPHKFLFLIVDVLLVFYAISFSIKLIKYLFFKVNINFKDVFRKYVKILIITMIANFVFSIYECYIVTFILRLFIFLF